MQQGPKFQYISLHLILNQQVTEPKLPIRFAATILLPRVTERKMQIYFVAYIPPAAKLLISLIL